MWPDLFIRQLGLIDPRIVLVNREFRNVVKPSLVEGFIHRHNARTAVQTCLQLHMGPSIWRDVVRLVPRHIVMDHLHFMPHMFREAVCQETGIDITRFHVDEHEPLGDFQEHLDNPSMWCKLLVRASEASCVDMVTRLLELGAYAVVEAYIAGTPSVRKLLLQFDPTICFDDRIAAHAENGGFNDDPGSLMDLVRGGLAWHDVVAAMNVVSTDPQYHELLLYVCNQSPLSKVSQFARLVAQAGQLALCDKLMRAFPMTCTVILHQWNGQWNEPVFAMFDKVDKVQLLACAIRTCMPGTYESALSVCRQFVTAHKLAKSVDWTTMAILSVQADDDDVLMWILTDYGKYLRSLEVFRCIVCSPRKPARRVLEKMMSMIDDETIVSCAHCMTTALLRFVLQKGRFEPHTLSRILHVLIEGNCHTRLMPVLHAHGMAVTQMWDVAIDMMCERHDVFRCLVKLTNKEEAVLRHAVRSAVSRNHVTWARRLSNL